MSQSPPIRRLSTSSSSNSRQEELINAYEAEEERIINTLSRKLEKLREEKIELENALEAESESHVNRLSRELSILRRQQQQQQQQQQSNAVAGSSTFVNGAASSSTPFTNGNGTHAPPDPSTNVMLETLIRENEQLRHRLASAERSYVHTSRLCEIYREELIGHRTRMGRPVDDLVGMSNPSADALDQPTHRRNASSQSNSNTSPISTFHHHYAPLPPSRPPKHSIPIPRANTPSAHSPHHGAGKADSPMSISMSSSSISHAPFSDSTSASSTSDSPFPFSPPDHASSSHMPASLASNNTHLTTPSSSGSNPAIFPPTAGHRTLTYPSVPPPSLSSSPNVPYFYHPTFASTSGTSSASESRSQSQSRSPVEPLSRRGSNAGSARRGSFDWRSGEGGSMMIRGSRRSSVERGARVAETGVLVPRSRAGSQGQGQHQQLGQHGSGGQHVLGVTEEEMAAMSM